MKPLPRHNLIAALSGAAVLIMASILHILQGDLPITPSAVLAALSGEAPAQVQAVILHLRLPRLAAGLIAGAALAASGTIIQSVLRNDLASPATLGVNAGAFAAIVTGSVFFPSVSAVLGPELAFLGGLGAAAIVFAVSAGTDHSPVRMVLAGVAVTFLASSISATLQLFFEQETAGLFFWGSGSLLQTGWTGVASAAWRLVPGLAAALLVAGHSQLIGLGDETAKSRGQNVQAVRLTGAAVGVFLAATAIHVAGPLGFVGLAVPHLLRLMGIRTHRNLLLLSVIWGPVVVLSADILGRLMFSGPGEVPAGLLTTIVGAPLLVYLVHRRREARKSEESPAARSAPFERHPAAALLILAAVCISLCVFAVILGPKGFTTQTAIINLRLPRVLTALGAGAALALSGALLQGVIRNPLAAPSILGVTSGASFGALGLVLGIGGGASVYALMPFAAFAGGLAAFLLVWLLSVRAGLSPARVALTGVGIGAVFSGMVNLLVIGADVRIASALTWLSGSLYARTSSHAAVVVTAVLLLALPAMLFVKRLDAMAIEDRVLSAVGMRVKLFRALVMLTAVALASSATAVVGAVGFVGLVGPHASRLLFGRRHALLLPTSALLGAALLVAADWAGRTLVAPSQIPAGLVTALVGGPYFIWLLRKGDRA